MLAKSARHRGRVLTLAAALVVVLVAAIVPLLFDQRGEGVAHSTSLDAVALAEQDPDTPGITPPDHLRSFDPSRTGERVRASS